MPERLVDRRSVATGTAWAVPAVAVAAAAPAFAASGCPVLTGVIQYVDQLNDRVVITNTSAVIIPSNITITWTVENRWNGANTLDFASYSRVTRTTGSDPFTFAALGTQFTYTFKSTTALAQNATLRWRYNWSQFFYETTIRVSFAGTSLASCPDQVFCASMADPTPGTVCA